MMREWFQCNRHKKVCTTVWKSSATLFKITQPSVIVKRPKTEKGRLIYEFLLLSILKTRDNEQHTLPQVICQGILCVYQGSGFEDRWSLKMSENWRCGVIWWVQDCVYERFDSQVWGGSHNLLSWTELIGVEIEIIRDWKGKFILSCDYKQRDMKRDNPPEAELEIIRDWKGEEKETVPLLLQMIEH